MAILRVRDDKGNIIDIPAIKGDKGEKGEKGEKGADGITPVIDQTYSPTSENAQSGKAVAQAIAGVPTVGSEVWEVIADTTLSEDGVVVINQDLTGNAFRLRGFRAHLRIPATADGTTPWLHANGYAFCQANPISANHIGLVYYLAELKGIWTCDTSAVSNTTGNHNTLTQRLGFVDGVRQESAHHSDPITTMSFCKGYSGALPAGTTIKVWGIRANEQ